MLRILYGSNSVIPITLHINVTRTLEIVNELKQIGWVIGKDFDFAHYKAEWDNFSGDAVTPQKTVFTIYKDINSSYFMLRWA
jgi:hypothetical protein